MVPSGDEADHSAGVLGPLLWKPPKKDDSSRGPGGVAPLALLPRPKRDLDRRRVARESSARANFGAGGGPELFGV